jgi:outer membrane protein TolC
MKKIRITMLMLCFSTISWAQKKFNNVTDFLQYATQKSISLQTSQLKVQQAQQGKLAAILSIPDVSGGINTSYTHNNKLPVTILPAAIFGGKEGETSQVRMGLPYQTGISQSIDIKLVNLEGWQNLKLAKLNNTITGNDVLLNKKNLEENLATTYYNIVQLQEQKKSTERNILIADSLLQISVNKHKNGLIKQQDVNDAKVNVLTITESKKNIEFVLLQQYNMLKSLADISVEENIAITETAETNVIKQAIDVQNSNLAYNTQKAREQYALENIKKTNYGLLPSLNFFANNANNSYNQTNTLYGGNFIHSNYLGLRLNWNIPNSNQVAGKDNAKYNYLLTQKSTEQTLVKAKLETEQLETGYHKAFSTYTSHKNIELLYQDTYQKNKNIYIQGLQSLDRAIASFNNLVNAQYNTIQSKVAILAAQSKIDINNKYSN